MHELSGFGSISSRHASYQRELEKFAMEVEDHLDVLREKPDQESIEYVVTRLQERLDAVHRASKV